MFADQLHIGTKIRLGENKNVLVPKLLMLKPSFSPPAVTTDVETEVTQVCHQLMVLNSLALLFAVEGI